MSRSSILLALLLTFSPPIAQCGETPPYDPAPPTDGMSTYTNHELAITLLYPKEFIPRTPEDLQTVIQRGHRLAFGNDPDSDPEHLQAMRCMHTLFYATPDPATVLGTTPGSDEQSADTILVEDVDRSCIPKKLKGDKALTALAGTILHLPGSVQLVQQMWFVAGKARHIHSGMAGTLFRPVRCSDKRKNAKDCSGIPLFVIASAVEQKGHYILIVYLSGTSGEKHTLVPHMSIAFQNERPVLLFPFLMKRVNLIK